MVGIFSICLDTSRAALPVECRAFVALPAPGPDGGRTAVVSEPGGPPAPVVADGVGPGWLERCARSAAPLRDATPDDQVVTLPDTCRLLDLLGERAIEPDRLAATWSADRPSTSAVIGVNPDGPHTVDLRHDGPHALVAGTTGAGKSELLQTVVASLALASSPADLSFVLVDYKGGSAFDHCAQLPHTVGLVTDLDPHLAERALTSLTAELKRREVVLRAAGAKDIDDYIHRRPRSTPGPAQPRLGRLVLVIDEFRMIAEELPEFLDGIVRIAALGRSLGVHLILATQRPAGIVTADIAANVNLRIALRVRDQVDSDDVIEARDAAAISTRTPGRAYARAGANPLVLFQTARVAGSGAAAQESGCAVRLLGVDDLGELRSTSALVEPDPVQTDLARIVAATRAAAERLDLPPVRRPWLPPLPELLTVDQLDAGPEPWAAPYAAVDRPERQAQQTLAWDLAGEAHLAVVGTMRSGRSTLLRTLAGSIAQRFGPDDVHLHVIDGGAGGLLPVGRLPHAGVVCPVDPPTRSVRLLDRLAEEVRRRRTLLAAGGFGSVVEHRAGVEPGHRLPFLVVLIDGWEGVSAAWEGVEHGRPVDLLQQLLRDGPGVGLLVALAGDRSLLLSRMSSLVRDKIVLRLADPTDLVLAGIRAAAVPGHLPAGRGVRLVDHAEVQVALLDPDPRGQAQIAALDRIAARSSIGARSVEERASHRPIRIQPLPRRVAVSGLEPAAGLRAPGWALVGAGGDAAQPVGLMVLGSSALVAGPPRSGRSTTLRTMAGWLGRHGTAVVAVTSGASALAGLAGSVGILDVVDVVDSVAVRRLRTLLASGPDLCVVVDDVEHLLDTEAEEVVLHWFKSPTRGAGSLLVAGRAADLSGLFRGLSVVARRSGQGVLLHPSSYADGDLLGVRLSGAEVTERLPGRGLLVSEGQTQEVQAAWEPDRPGQNDGRADPGPNSS
jgi:S-DNA-T family DNA segregation ATPase FtsK/SpoIIIE